MTPVTLEMLMREQAKMIGRMADMEKRITDNADKAHDKIGSNIAKLSEQMATIEKHLDLIDADIKTVKGSVQHMDNKLADRGIM